LSLALLSCKDAGAVGQAALRQAETGKTPPTVNAAGLPDGKAGGGALGFPVRGLNGPAYLGFPAKSENPGECC